MATRKQIHQLTSAQFDHFFPDEEACCAYLVGKRWPKGVHCPRCGAAEPTELKGNPWHWQCYECAPQSSYRFSHITGTIFENTNKPLRDWFKVIHLMLTSKKGMSARQLYRYMGFGSLKTAWYMGHRVRVALANHDFEKLGGVVEVDETFVGGKAKNRHIDRRGDGDGTGGVGSGKAVVVGAVRRKGNVVARVIENVRATTLESFVAEAVSHKVSLLITDQWVGYKHLNKEFPQHVTIDHAKGQYVDNNILYLDAKKREYVVGAVHTNTIEGFWSIFKRGVIGTFHNISKKYLPLYVAEFQFRYNNRYNNRENADIFGVAIEGC